MSLQEIIEAIIGAFGLILLLILVCFDELTEQLQTALCIIVPVFIVVAGCIKFGIWEF